MLFFHRFSQISWEDIFWGMLVTGGLIMSFYFLTKQLWWNLTDRLPASIICLLSLRLPLDYGSSRIWPMILLLLWLLWFLCAPYILSLLTKLSRRGGFPLHHSRNTKQLNLPEQAGLQLLYVDKKAQRSQKVLLKLGLCLIVARQIKECMNHKYI